MVKRVLIVVMMIFLFLLGLMVFTSAEINKFNSKRSNLNQINQQKSFDINSEFVGKKAFYIKSTGKINLSEIVNKNKIRTEKKDELSADLTKEDIKNLQKIPGITIKAVPIYSILLQQSVPLINATKTWGINEKGVNLTGSGETICVIDTGVNYNHPDLGGCYGNNNIISSCKVIGGHDYYNNDDNPMDDNGHGTHVSGIAAANGSIKGTAPDARLVSIKVCDNTGLICYEDYIARGIEWCINRSVEFNISVISMSLGGTTYSGYCNNENLAVDINNATLYNISTVIASGNNGYYNAVSSPACVENATPVTSTNKQDTSISSFANTWNDKSLLILAAPGENINSTYGSSYGILNGTSMATPHVAGAIAIMRQFLKIINQTKTPEQIEIILNNTGKIIDDTSISGRNFTRINIYNAILSLDEINVTLSSPQNNTFTNINKTFFCNASSSLPLLNLSFYIWNSTSLINVSNVSIGGLTNSSNFTYNFTYEDNYHWNCLASDNLSKSVFASSNFSITYDLTPLAINITSPINNSWYDAGRFNVTLNENGSCLYSLNYGVNNFTMNSSDNQNFTAINYTLLQDNSYNVSFYCNDSAGNRNNTIRTFKIDLIPPNVTLTDPFPTDETSNSVSKTFYYNATDNLNLSKCNLILNGASVAENASIITNLTNNITHTLTPAVYSWNINCTDIAGNTGNSSSRTLTINSVPAVVQNNGGGGGGGSGTPSGVNNVLTIQQAEQGVTRELAKNDKFTFEIKTSIGNEKHTLALNNVTDSRINITIFSNPINLILGVGQSVKLNLTSPDYYNLFIKLEGIKENRANITIKTINEPIRTIAEEKNETPQQIQIPQNVKKNNNRIYYIIEVLIIFLIITIIRKYLIVKHTHRRRKIHHHIHHTN